MAEIKIVATPTVGVRPLSVSFSVDIVSGDFISFYWDFGDGGTSNRSTVTHVYSTTGYHTVTLIGTLSNRSTVTVIERGLVRIGEISFTASPSVSDEEPTNVTFTNASLAPTGYEFQNWQWDFGDVSIGSGLTGPSHIYGEYGDYNVTLSAKMLKMDE